MSNTTPGQKPFPFDQARESILSIEQVSEVKFLKTEDGALNGIRALSNGGLPDKIVAGRISSILLLDLDIEVDHRIIKVVSRAEKSSLSKVETGEAR